MASGPLHWFRKNQKLMLGVFGVGLIFVFTISMGSGVDPLVDRLTGAGPTASRDSVAVEWDGGDLSEEQLEQLRIGRNLLGRFLGTVRQIAAERGGVQRVTMLPLYTSDRSLLELELLVAEAEKIGIEVGDAAVLDYLKQLSDGTVSANEYGTLLRNATRSNLSETQLLDLMARELKAQKVRSMVQSGGYPTSPIAAWDYYNRLNRLVKAEMLPISVDDYLDKVEDPGEVEIAEMYEKYKDKYPFPLSPEPGFRKREQRAFQYVKVDYDAILEAEKAAVTDEQVKQYYEENKEQYRKDAPSDLDLELDGKTNVPGDVSAEPADTPAVEEAESASGGDAASDAETNATEDASAPAAGAATDATTGEAADPPAAAPEVEETGPQNIPAETESLQSDLDPDPAPTALPQEDDENPQEDADEETEDETAPEEADETAVEEDGETSAEESDEAAAEETDATSGDTETTDVDAEVTEEKAATEAEVATEAELATDTDEEPAVAASDEDAAESDEPTTTEDQGEPGEAATAVESSDLDPVESEEPVYEALADVADEIRQTIASPRAQEKMNSIISDVKRELAKYHNEYTIWDIERENDPEAKKPASPDVSALAAGDQVVVGEIPLIGPLQVEDFEIGRAFDLRFPQQGGVQRVMFADTAFSSDKTSLYNPQVIPDIDVATNRFVYWMTDVKDEYIPELDQVRPEVVQALKRQRAVGLALEDAKTLAQKAEQQNAKLSESLSDRDNAEFIDTGEITWVTPPMMEGSTPRISAIPGAEDASPELRETLFRLAPGEVGYAANMPKSKVYVFRVEDVNPAPELRREQFLRGGVNAPVLFLARRDSLVDLSEWYRDLSEQHGVQWKRDPRAS